MTTITPVLPLQLTLQPATLVVDREGRQNALRVDQVIRAVVAEDSEQRVLLELGQRKFLLPEGVVLRPGQHLDVRVVQTQPSLQLEVLSRPPDPRSVPPLALLGQQLDWGGLAAAILQHQSQLPPAMAPALQQPMQLLQQLLQQPPAEPLATRVFAQLPALLGLETEHEAVTAGRWPANLKTGLQALLTTFRQQQQQPVVQDLRGIVDRMALLPQRLKQAPDSLMPELRSLLERLQQLRPQLPAATHPLVQGVEDRLTQARTVLQDPVPGIVPDLRSVSTALGVPLVAAHPPELVRPPDLATGLLILLGRSQDAAAPDTDTRPAPLSSEVRQLLADVQQLATHADTRPTANALQALGARLLRLLPQLSPADRTLLDAFPEHLQTLATAAEDTAINDPLLGTRVVDLLGRWLLSATVQPDRLATQDPSAKTALELLLGLFLRGGRDPAIPEAKQGLHQLESLQQARNQLADQGAQLLPLPFPFLEEGYLLVEPRSERNNTQQEGEPATRLTLLLRLQRLGNLQISMLYDPQGMYLRFQCESETVRHFLQGCTSELGGRLGDIPLRSVSFSTGAEDPGAVVIRRASEGRSRGLDQRI